MKLDGARHIMSRLRDILADPIISPVHVDGLAEQHAFKFDGIREDCAIGQAEFVIMRHPASIAFAAVAA